MEMKSCNIGVNISIILERCVENVGIFFAKHAFMIAGCENCRPAAAHLTKHHDKIFIISSILGT